MALEKPSIFDKVVDKLHQRREVVRLKLAEQYRRTRPFRTEPVSRVQQEKEITELFPEQESALRQTMGDDIVDRYKLILEQKHRGNGNA